MKPNKEVVFYTIEELVNFLSSLPKSYFTPIEICYATYSELTIDYSRNGNNTFLRFMKDTNWFMDEINTNPSIDTLICNFVFSKSPFIVIKDSKNKVIRIKQ